MKLSDLSTRLGLLAGVLITFFLLLFQFSGWDYAPRYKVFKYILLAILLGYGIYMVNKRDKNHVFKRGLQFGLRFSFITALTMALVNVVLFMTMPEYAFSLYSLIPESFLHLAMISVALIFETVVFGSLISFALVQYFKRPGPELQ